MGREVAVDAVIVEAGKVLLILRDHEPFRGFWVLPGGHVEENETVEQAVVREIKEEVGLDVEIVGLIGIFSDPSRDPRGLVSVAFLTRPTGGQLRLNRESKDAKWFPIDALPENIGFDHELILETAKKLLRKNKENSNDH